MNQLYERLFEKLATQMKMIFQADTVFVNNYITQQSNDIAQGVDAKKVEGKGTNEQGAGDHELCLDLLVSKLLNICLHR